MTPTLFVIYFKDKIELILNRQTGTGLKGHPRIEEPEVIYYVMQ